MLRFDLYRRGAAKRRRGWRRRRPVQLDGVYGGVTRRNVDILVISARNAIHLKDSLRGNEMRGDYSHVISRLPDHGCVPAVNLGLLVNISQNAVARAGRLPLRQKVRREFSGAAGIRLR